MITCRLAGAKSLSEPWWRHQMETFSALLAISPVPGEFPAQRLVTRSFDVFFDLRLNQRLSEQSWGWWFETLPHPLWRHCNECWIVVNWKLKNKLKWNIERNFYIFIQENAFQNVVCKMAATLLWSVNSVEVSKSYLPKDVWTVLPFSVFLDCIWVKGFYNGLVT